MAPFDLHPLSGTFAYFAIYLLLGMGFGAVLEMSGFGDSRKLAAQFYLRDMTVLKVMFTGIVVAAVLIHLASAFGLVDLQRVWVNPTYLLPGIVGGLIMGVGFILGGFCPGTSLVAASTLKLDGVFFVLGVLTGVFAFGEAVGEFEGFFQSTFLGRFTVADWLGLPAGLVVLLLAAMALAVFHLAEVSEAVHGAGRTAGSVAWIPRRRSRALAAAALLALALVAVVKGEPTVEAKWRRMSGRGEAQIRDREIYLDPAEVVELRRDLTLRVRLLEVRTERDWNLFHLEGSRRIDLTDCDGTDLVGELQQAPDNTITILASNGESAATAAWKNLKAQGVLNLYVVDGGINRWLDLYPPHPCLALRRAAAAGQGGHGGEGGPDREPGRSNEAAAAPDEEMRWVFSAAVGDRTPSAHPELARREFIPDCPGSTADWFNGRNAPARDYVKKVKLQRKVVARGGCG